jgi:hypothetical protein
METKLFNDDKEQRGNKNSTKVVIITSVDDDNEQILSYLNPTTIGTIVVDLNETNLMNGYQKSSVGDFYSN